MNTVPNEFNGLYQKALELLSACKAKNEQSIALETETGDIICKKILAMSDDEEKLVADIGSCVIVRLVCMWTGGHIDLPSHKFRKLLIDANVNNQNAEMLLVGRDCLIVKSIAKTVH